jgi:hydroxymethylpyrimidine/phosphomethylpyrimidine kinase
LKVALSIAGSDSGAGAGIQADIKTFSALGVYGCTAITAVTAQNTRGVSRIFEVSPLMIEEQMQAILDDIPPDAIKIGMVYSKDAIDVVCRLLRNSKPPIVLDPIFAAGTGASLLREEAVDALVSNLIPICALITPNRTEAERLTGIKIKNYVDALEAARRIRKMGAKNVIVKSGHHERATVTDLFVDNRSRHTKITNPRVRMNETHGSGCNFSAAITAYLARGMALLDACKLANEYVHNAIRSAVKLGKGLPVTNPLSSVYKDAMSYHTLEELQKAVEEVGGLNRFFVLIPETQTNFVYALPGAAQVSEVAGVRGRIVRIGNTSVPTSYIEFGASRHVASAVVAYMKHDPMIRAAINLRFDPNLLRVCRSLFEVSSYDRKREPSAIKRKEGATVEWGTRHALSKNPRAEIIYHTGDFGKEPMILLFGRTPAEVVTKIKSVLKHYQ